MTEFTQRAGRDLMRFALAVVITVWALVALNALPEALGGDPPGVARYASAAAVRERYGVGLWLPKALPEGWAVRSTHVRVAVGGVDWAQLAYGGPGAALLTTCQALEATGASDAAPGQLLPPGSLLQRETIVVAGRRAQARRLLMPDGSLVHELWWREGNRSIMLRLNGSLEDLMRVARLALGAAS